MTINLTKLKDGQIVKFRSGCEAAPYRIMRWGEGTVKLFFHATSRDPIEGEEYSANGKFKGTIYHHAFDIIEIIDPPFDWSTVKPGMAFVHTIGVVYHYIEPYPYHSEFIPVRDMFGGWPVYLPKSELNRCPYYDRRVF